MNKINYLAATGQATPPLLKPQVELNLKDYNIYVNMFGVDVAEIHNGKFTPLVDIVEKTGDLMWWGTNDQGEPALMMTFDPKDFERFWMADVKAPTFNEFYEKHFTKSKIRKMKSKLKEFIENFKLMTSRSAMREKIYELVETNDKAVERNERQAIRLLEKEIDADKLIEVNDSLSAQLEAATKLIKEYAGMEDQRDEAVKKYVDAVKALNQISISKTATYARHTAIAFLDKNK